MSESNQNYISRVHFKGYKSLVDLEVDLRPGLNVIIGPNGSGKTNFLEFLYQTMLKYPPHHAFFSQIEVKQTKEESKILEFESNAGDDKGVSLIYSTREILNGKESRKARWKTFEDKRLLPEFIEQTGEKPTLHDAFNVPFLLGFGIPANQSFFSNPVSFALYENNGGLHYYFYTQTEPPNWFSKIFSGKKGIRSIQDLREQIDFSLINNYVRKYSPIEAIRFDEKKIIFYDDPTTFHEVIENLIFQFSVSGKWLYWNQLSDGTKRIFYIISTVVYYEKYILLEEPELGIHPDQLHKLMDFLKEQSAEKQIILTTHSPEVLNILGPDDLDRIIVTRFDRERGTQMHHLSERQQQKARTYIKETGFLSDFWVHSNLEEYEAEQAKN